MRITKQHGSANPAASPTKDTHPQGPEHRVAGARTSVSAPLDLDQTKTNRWAARNHGSPRDRPGENRLSASERHASRPCPEGTFLDSPGFERSSTLGCVPVQTISPEGAGLIRVLRETVGRMLACFGGGAGHCHGCSNRTLRQANPHGVQRSI